MAAPARRITAALGLVVLAVCVPAAGAQNATESMAQGRAAAARGDYQLAVAYYTSAVKADPSLTEAYYARGVNCAKIRTPEFLAFALADLDTVLTRQPRHAGALASRCYVKIEQGDMSGALADCNAALTIEPTADGTYVNRGRIHSRRQDHAAAIRDYTAALRLNPSNRMALNNRGAVRRRTGDLQGARADYEKALAIAPDYELARRGLAQVLADLEGTSSGGRSSSRPAAVPEADGALPPPPPIPDTRAGSVARTTTGPPPMPDAPAGPVTRLPTGGPPPLPPAPAKTPTTGAARHTDARVAGRDVPEPTRTTYVAPLYPADAKRAGVTGRVGLRLTLGPDGRVTEAVVTRSVPRLDEAALVAARQWRFLRTKVDGVAVPVVVTVNVDFPPK